MLQNQAGIPSSSETTERRGFALFMALGALVIIGVLVAASSFITLQENRLGQNSLVQARAFAVAEYGLNKIQSDWDKTPNLTMANGSKFDTTYTLSGQGTANVRYIRLNDETFWIVSEGLAIVGNNTSLSRQARKRVGAILRLRIPTLEAKGAITAGGNVTVRGNAGVNGRDSIPANWGCTNSQQNMPGIVVPPGSSVSTVGNSASIAGTPATATDTAAASASTYFGFGEENWSTLIAMKNVLIDSASATPTRTPYPTVSGGSCNKTDMGNWGEPMRTATYENSMTGALQPDCYNYFPIIYAPGGLKLSGNGRGQGILLIKGNLEINGTFDWYGVIVVTNDIIRGNGNARVMGAVMARNETTADASVISGTTSYNYSQCGVERALKGSAQVVQAKERAWAELY
jgi:hypothetical protein